MELNSFPPSLLPFQVQGTDILSTYCMKQASCQMLSHAFNHHKIFLGKTYHYFTADKTEDHRGYVIHSRLYDQCVCSTHACSLWCAKPKSVSPPQNYFTGFPNPIYQIEAMSTICIVIYKNMLFFSLAFCRNLRSIDEHSKERKKNVQSYHAEITSANIIVDIFSGGKHIHIYHLCFSAALYSFISMKQQQKLKLRQIKNLPKVYSWNVVEPRITPWVDFIQSRTDYHTSNYVKGEERRAFQESLILII